MNPPILQHTVNINALVNQSVLSEVGLLIITFLKCPVSNILRPTNSVTKHTLTSQQNSYWGRSLQLMVTCLLLPKNGVSAFFISSGMGKTTAFYPRGKSLVLRELNETKSGANVINMDSKMGGKIVPCRNNSHCGKVRLKFRSQLHNAGKESQS